MRRTIIIVLCAMLAAPSFGQFNMGGRPSQAETEKAGHQKDCESWKEDLQISIERCNKYLDENNLESVKSYLISAKNDLARIEEGKTEYGCKIDITNEEKQLNETDARYQQMLNESSAAEDNKEADLEKVKQAVWSLDPLKNQLNFGNIGMMDKLSEAEDFLQNCKNIDFINKAPDIVEISKKYPEEFQPDYEMKGYKEDFCEKFPAWLKEQVDFLKGEINSAMMEANKTKSKHVNFLGQAVDMAHAALVTAEGCLILYPGDKEFYSLYQTAKTNYDQISKEFAATTYTSDLHAKYAGKIVFSKQPIQIKAENEASFQTAFSGTDNIYAMMYLKNNLLSIQGSGYISTRIYANGTQIAEHEWKPSADQRNSTYNDAEIMPSPQTSSTFGALKFYEAFSSSLLPGKNKIKVVLMDDGNNVVAEGEFELDCSGGTDNITQRYKELKEIRLEKVRMPEATIIDPSLEASMVAAMAAQNWPEKALRAVITGDSWITHRGAFGEILLREMYAAVAFKTPEGTCKIFYMSFKQDYDGSSYGKTKYFSVGGNEEINCENVYK